MRRSAAVVWVGLLLVVVMVSGCGGSSQSQAEKWADNVCTSIGDWRQELSSLRNDLTTKAQNGTLNANELRSGLDQALSETKALVDNLREVGPPNTDAGQEARQKLDDAMSTVSTAIGSAKSKAESAGSLPAAIAAVAPGLTQATQTVASELQQVSQLDPQGELGKAFDDTESCQDLRK